MPVILYSKIPKLIPKNVSQYCFAASEKKLGRNIPEIYNLSQKLEDCFNQVRDIWWKLGKQLSETPGGSLAHMPTCSTYASDFAQIAAWSILIRRLANETEVTLIICYDPWLFRDVADFCDVKTRPPPISMPTLFLNIRGVFARLKLIFCIAWAHLLSHHTRRNHTNGKKVLLVYSHPESRVDGFDAYFGELMNTNTKLLRLIHTDGNIHHSIRLSKDGRTASLHAWGKLRWLPNLIFQRWKPSKSQFGDIFPWLISRAVKIEASGASAAKTAWQNLCQNAWMNDIKPKVVIWPWENHPWERNFTKIARQKKITTVGYQHTVVGRHMYNQSPFSNSNGVSGLPDKLLANGPVYRDNLLVWGVPKNRLSVAGSYRQRLGSPKLYDPKGPIFVGLPNNSMFARQIINAIIKSALEGVGPFLVKSHPMYPYLENLSKGVTFTNKHLSEITGVSALIYCTGTIGLEGILSGIPTLRFQPRGFVAVDILPQGIKAKDVNASNLHDVLKNLPAPPEYNPFSVFSPIQSNVWAQILESESSFSDATDEKNSIGKPQK